MSIDCKYDPSGSDDELRAIRDEVHRLAKQAVEEDLERIRRRVEDCPESRGALAPAAAPVVRDPGLIVPGDRPLVRTAVAAAALVGLLFGGPWAIENLHLRTTAAPSGTQMASFRPEVYTVSKPVVDTVMTQEPYTVDREVKYTDYKSEEYTVSRPRTETVMEDEVYTVTRPVRRVTYRNEVYTEMEPRTETVWVAVREMVPVPRSELYVAYRAPGTNYVERIRWVPRRVTRMVAVEKVRRMPVETIRYVKQERTRQVPVERTRYVAETATRQVPVEKTRTVQEVKYREVPKQVTRYVDEQRVRLVPVTGDEPPGSAQPAG